MQNKQITTHKLNPKQVFDFLDLILRIFSLQVYFFKELYKVVEGHSWILYSWHSVIDSVRIFSGCLLNAAKMMLCRNVISTFVNVFWIFLNKFSVVLNVFYSRFKMHQKFSWIPNFNVSKCIPMKNSSMQFSLSLMLVLNSQIGSQLTYSLRQFTLKLPKWRSLWMVLLQP